MNESLTAEQIRATASAVFTTFHDVPRQPVPVGVPWSVNANESDEVVARYLRHGFAIMEIDVRPITSRMLLRLADAFDLGEAFLPPLYRNGVAVASRVSTISVALNADTVDELHPSFGRAVGQQLHCDGTLQDIGHIKASLLLCESPAAEGGHTILFNASAAFAELAAQDARAAAALMAPGALVRQANINGSTELNVGPVFAVQNGALVCHYCVTETDRWAVPEGVAEADLRRGLEFLGRVAAPGSPLFVELTLQAGQAIILDNTRISHGRTSYRDSPDVRRCLYRSLHLRHPQPRWPTVATSVGGLNTRAEMIPVQVGYPRQGDDSKEVIS